VIFLSVCFVGNDLFYKGVISSLYMLCACKSMFNNLKVINFFKHSIIPGVNVFICDCIKTGMKHFFTIKLIEWHIQHNKRIMPWKGEKNPYKIWLSEIILQQTRVEQGLSYYNKFVHSYPQIENLAKAPDEDVFKLWEGLGYYTRCKNLLVTARFVANELEGKFPSKYEEILSLKGIGPYTAAAISSFGFGLPYAVVDGNVFRVLARYFGEAKAIDSNEGKKFFTRLAQKLLVKEDPALYNQAIMDFGAIVCKPQIPHCQECMLRVNCVAFESGLVNKLPVKEKQLVKKERWLYYFVFKHKNNVLVNKRVGKGIWENLFEFYLFESFKSQRWTKATLKEWMNEQLGITNYSLAGISGIYKQQLTHQKLQGQFINIHLEKVPKSLQHMQLVNTTEFKKLSFPRFINQYLEEEQVKVDSHALFS
jgi:A/G-specific adenine glycosylase